MIKSLFYRWFARCPTLTYIVANGIFPLMVNHTLKRVDKLIEETPDEYQLDVCDKDLRWCQYFRVPNDEVQRKVYLELKDEGLRLLQRHGEWLQQRVTEVHPEYAPFLKQLAPEHQIALAEWHPDIFICLKVKVCNQAVQIYKGINKL